jgi:uncharacterized protein YybS (DUF2232 family)
LACWIVTTSNGVVFVLELDKMVFYFHEKEYPIHVIKKIIITILVLVLVPPTHKWNPRIQF